MTPQVGPQVHLHSLVYVALKNKTEMEEFLSNWIVCTHVYLGAYQMMACPSLDLGVFTKKEQINCLFVKKR